MQRLSLRSALVAVALLALGLGAIASQSRLAASAAYTAFWLANLLALAAALVARGPARAFGVGGALFGVGYWMLAFESEPQPTITPVSRIWLYSGITRLAATQVDPRAEPPGNRLLTAELVDRLEESVRPRLAPGVKVTAQYNGGAYYLGKVQSFDGSSYLIAWDDGTPPSPVPPTGIRGHIPYIRTSAHSVLGLLAALFGGLSARVLFARFGTPDARRGGEVGGS